MGLTLAEIEWQDALKVLLGGGLSAVITAAGWVLLRYYRGSAEKIVKVAEVEIRAGAAAAEQERQDRIASMEEYARAVEEWREIGRRYETRVRKLEQRDEDRQKEYELHSAAMQVRYDKIFERERQCQQTLALVLDRLTSHEEALKSANIPFRAMRRDFEIETHGPEGGGI